MTNLDSVAWTLVAVVMLGALSFVLTWLRSSGDRKAGAQMAQGQAAAGAARSQAAIAKAEVSAPDTAAKLNDRLRKGTF